MNIHDLAVLGDWYEDQGENGEIVRNLLFLFSQSPFNLFNGKNQGHGLGYRFSFEYYNDPLGYPACVGYSWCEIGFIRSSRFAPCLEFRGLGSAG